MRKIPTVYQRDPEDMKHVTDEVHPECGWVLNGEGEATRKYDGTCVMMDTEGRWWARREVKAGKVAPGGFHLIVTDPNTGKSVGWEPIDRSPFMKFWREAIVGDRAYMVRPGTYELCGPKINGNPEGFERHELIRHADAEPVYGNNPEEMIAYCRERSWEGVVWRHPDGRMAKLKVRDFA